MKYAEMVPRGKLKKLSKSDRIRIKDMRNRMERFDILREDVCIGLELATQIQTKENVNAIRVVEEWLKDQTTFNGCYYTKEEIEIGLKIARRLVKNEKWKKKGVQHGEKRLGENC